jgi:predicted O-methyltransferase YrrM
MSMLSRLVRDSRQQLAAFWQPRSREIVRNSRDEDLATYRHAFETTAADRDRLAAYAKELQERLDAIAMEAAARAPALPKPESPNMPPPLDLPPEIFDVTAHLPGGPLAASIPSILADPEFQRLHRMCESWPAGSTIISVERALLIWLIKATDARNVLEIGTYFAGTTFALAAAVLSVGGGEVHTIDPYGGERAPRLLSRWPTELARLVRFRAVYSCEFLDMMTRIPIFDIIFVDGNHSYPNVMHDITAATLNLRPGGFIFIDNAEQPAVLSATRDNLILNPQLQCMLVSSGGKWQYRAQGISESNEFPYFCAILRTDHELSIGDRFVNYHIFGVNVLKLSEFVFLIDGESPKGDIRLQYHLRSHPRGPLENDNIRDLHEILMTEIRPETRNCTLHPTLELPIESEGQINFAEISATFRSAEPGGRLHGVRLLVDGHTVQPGRNWWQ